MTELLNNKFLRYGALALLLQAVLSHPVEYCVYVLAALCIYFSKDSDLKLLQDIKTSLAKVDLSSVKKLFNKSEDPVVEQEVVMEPVVKPAPEAPAQEVVEQEVESAPEPKVKVSKGFGSKI